MDKHRLAITAALVLGVAAGSYGIASAASGNGNSTTTTTTPSTTQSAPTAPAAPSGQPWGHQRSEETVLTGDAASKVTAIAKEKVPGGTVIRVETDADGNAMYEAHLVKSDGTPVTVYVDKDFNFVSVDTGGPGGHGGFGGSPPAQQQQSGATA
ncbi:MAG: PepSY domain-containing protein [Gaiellaceae bacterium]